MARREGEVGGVFCEYNFWPRYNGTRLHALLSDCFSVNMMCCNVPDPHLDMYDAVTIGDQPGWRISLSVVAIMYYHHMAR